MTRIETLYRAATPQEFHEGESWYPSALRFARSLAVRYGVPVHTVVGIIAVLSPGMDWERNKAEAEQCLLTKAGKAHWGVYSSVKPKLLALLSGSDPLEVISGPKVTAFYRAIMGDTEAVVIDRHAKCAALGIRKNRDKNSAVSKKEYRELSARYTKVARKLGVNPRDLQAIIWVHWRNTLSPMSE